MQRVQIRSVTVSAVQDGVILGADTRSTSGNTVADKNCEKIHYIAPNIYCCGAGTAADTENVTGASHACLGSSSWCSAVCEAPHAFAARRVSGIRAIVACAGMVSSSLELHRYATGRSSRVVTALTLLKSHLFK